VLRPFYQDQLLPEAGCDEAGRGCLAGPVFAAAVILPRDFRHDFLTDSKQLTEKQRDELRVVIEREALSYAVARVDPAEIDRINILKASFKAMHGALDQLKKRPRLLLIDGNRFVPYKKIPYHCIVKGDATYLSIAAASILAKTYRDEYMLQLHTQYPHYGWDQNKGYGTESHRRALEAYGLSPHHRRSFQWKKVQLDLFE
jgi:ribonuclease HII